MRRRGQPGKSGALQALRVGSHPIFAVTRVSDRYPPISPSISGFVANVRLDQTSALARSVSQITPVSARPERLPLIPRNLGATRPEQRRWRSGGRQGRGHHGSGGWCRRDRAPDARAAVGTPPFPARSSLPGGRAGSGALLPRVAPRREALGGDAGGFAGDPAVPGRLVVGAARKDCGGRTGQCQ